MSGGVAESEGAVVVPEVKREYVSNVFASSETRKSQLRGNRHEAHPFEAKKCSQNQQFQILSIPVPESIKMKLHLYVFFAFL